MGRTGKVDGFGTRSDSQRSATQRLRRCCVLFAEIAAMVYPSEIDRARFHRCR